MKNQQLSKSLSSANEVRCGTSPVLTEAVIVVAVAASNVYLHLVLSHDIRARV